MFWTSINDASSSTRERLTVDEDGTDESLCCLKRSCTQVANDGNAKWKARRITSLRDLLSFSKRLNNKACTSCMAE